MGSLKIQKQLWSEQCAENLIIRVLKDRLIGDFADLIERASKLGEAVSDEGKESDFQDFVENALTAWLLDCVPRIHNEGLDIKTLWGDFVNETAVEAETKVVKIG
jgi:hypothetical protein